MQDNTIEELRNASPSILDAEQEKVETCIQVLKAEASQLKPCLEKEMLEATILFLEEEVQH